MEGPDGKDQLLSNRKYNIPVHVCHISKRGKNWIDRKKEMASDEADPDIIQHKTLSTNHR